jgi:hypothetical protein
MLRVHASAVVRTFLTAVSCSVMTFGLAAPSSAQATRAEQIAAEQAEKSKTISAEQAGKGEQAVIRALKSPLLAGTGGLYPWFGSVFGGSGFAAGAGYLRRLPNRGGLSLIGGISINGSMMADVDWRIPVPRRSRLRPRLNAHWVDANEVSYYGVGPLTVPEDKTQYGYSPTRLQAFLDVDALPWLVLSGNVGYMDMSTSADFNIQSPAFAGLGESIQFTTTGVAIAADSRTSPLYSVRGGFVRASWSHYDAHDQAPFTFDTTEFEAAHLIPVFREQYVFAFRVLATTTDTGDGQDVPFVLRPYLGSGDTLRSFPNRRFSDASRALATAEYRWRPSRYLDMALFVDSGTVAPGLDDVSDSRFSTSWGIGARFHGPAFTAFRIEAAHGHEGWNLVFSSGQPF